MKMSTALLALACVALAANVAFAQADLLPDKSTTIARVEEAPILDGILDESMWSQAVVVDDFHEVRPTEYSESAQRTEFLLAYDDEHLYIGARVFEEDPARSPRRCSGRAVSFALTIA